jgi:hypothetical protein
MVKCGVLFEVRTVFLNIIKTDVGFKGLIGSGIRVVFFGQTISSAETVVFLM